MSSRSRLASATLFAWMTAGALLAGCGGGGSTSSSTPTSSASGAKPAASTAASTATTTKPATAAKPATASSSASGTTKPGASLALGVSATVPYQPVGANQSAAAKFELRVTVTAIEKGSLSDFNGIKLNSTEKASTPFYVKARIENAGSGDAGAEGNPSVEVEGVDSSGETQQSVVFLGEFPRCEYREPPKPFSHGKSFTTCLTFLVPGGITKAAYTGYEPYVLTPVTWK